MSGSDILENVFSDEAITNIGNSNHIKPQVLQSITTKKNSAQGVNLVI